MTTRQSSERFEQAFVWALGHPELKQLARACYVTYDVLDDARRFCCSEEFSETVTILSSLGRGPGEGYELLDFGCGNGIASYAFSRSGYAVTATDLCQGEVAGLGAARRLAHSGGYDFQIEYDSDFVLNLSARSFDVVYCRQALHHLESLDDKLFAALACSLRPGGIFCAIREQVIWSEEQRQRLKREHPLNHITQDEDGYYLHEYKAALNSHGLQLVKTLWPYDSIINTYPTHPAKVRSPFTRWLPLIGPALMQLPGLRKYLLRLVSYLQRLEPPWQIWSFFAVMQAK